MGWIRRRIVGYVLFAGIASVLGSVAVSQGYLTGEPSLATGCGALILLIAFLGSYSATRWMKRRATARKAARPHG